MNPLYSSIPSFSICSLLLSHGLTPLSLTRSPVPSSLSSSESPKSENHSCFQERNLISREGTTAPWDLSRNWLSTGWGHLAYRGEVSESIFREWWIGTCARFGLHRRDRSLSSALIEISFPNYSRLLKFTNSAESLSLALALAALLDGTSSSKPSSMHSFASSKTKKSHRSASDFSGNKDYLSSFEQAGGLATWFSRRLVAALQVCLCRCLPASWGRSLSLWVRPDWTL